MTPLAIAAAVPLCVWMFIALARGSLLLSCVVFVVTSACFPAEFFSIDAAGLTWTLDRAWLLAILGQFAIKWYRGETWPVRFETTDLLLGLFFLWLLARTLTQPLGIAIKGQPPTLMHLVNGYLTPLVIYGVLRFSKLEPMQLRPALWCLAFFGIYLSMTAVFEVTHQWQWVYPKFIADPSLGIHFGRARGPMLQSVRLGICLLLVATSLIVFTVWLRPTSKSLWLVCAALIPLHLLAVFLTYTRSIWMGAAWIVVMLVAGCLQGTMRRLAIVGIVGVAVLALAIKGPDLVAFKREYSAAETRESTYMRASFAYVSWKMFLDRPVTGFGFNQFQVYDRPYLADRSTELRLESIRGYVHHNSFLSLLVDLGMVGFCLYIAVLVAFARQAWNLWHAARSPQWARAVAILSGCVAGVHALQMAFHEVSFSAIENSILYGAWGLTAACHWQLVGSAVFHRGDAESAEKAGNQTAPLAVS
ncbi:MAG: O-antigen ligase family protein [Aureliella sp.]